MKTERKPKGYGDWVFAERDEVLALIREDGGYIKYGKPRAYMGPIARGRGSCIYMGNHYGEWVIRTLQRQNFIYKSADTRTETVYKAVQANQ